MNKNFVFAFFALIGVVIGAGIFGLPYVVAKSGWLTAFFYLFILGGAVLLIHLFLGEIILRTQGAPRLVGLADKYLGKKGRNVVIISLLFGSIGALLAYIILAGNFLEIVFSFSGISSFYFSIILCLFLSIFIFRGIKIIGPTEVFTNILFFLIIFLIISFALPKFDLANFSLINSEHIFLPYGIILFSFIGCSAIIEINQILKTKPERKNLKKIIILATAIVLIIYFLFCLAVVGVSGEKTSIDALSGLIPFLGPKIILFGALAGAITLADSFLVLGLYLKNTLFYDFKLSRNLSAFLICAIPLCLFLIGFRSFISVIGFVGTILGAIEGIIIILIFKKIKKLGNRQPEYSLKVPNFLLYTLGAIFILGALSQVFYFLN